MTHITRLVHFTQTCASMRILAAGCGRTIWIGRTLSRIAPPARQRIQFVLLHVQFEQYVRLNYSLPLIYFIFSSKRPGIGLIFAALSPPSRRSLLPTAFEGGAREKEIHTVPCCHFHDQNLNFIMYTHNEKKIVAQPRS